MYCRDRLLRQVSVYGTDVMLRLHFPRFRLPANIGGELNM